MSEFFRKTDAGRRELRERRLGLPRPGRNLLLIIDGTRSVQHWVAMIQGASLTDAAALLELGLIEPGTGSPVGDSQFAGMLPTATSGLNDLPTTPAGWTQLGGLTRPDGLPSPGAAPRHRGMLDPASAAASTQASPLAPATTARRPLTHPEQAAAAVRTRPAELTPDPRARLQRGTRLTPVAAPTDATLGGADSLLDDPNGFVPLDPAAGGATGLGYSELYDSLNALVRETLGLLKGYRFSLRIERANNLAELEAVALEFVQEVRRLRGDGLARMVERALGLGG